MTTRLLALSAQLRSRRFVRGAFGVACAVAVGISTGCKNRGGGGDAPVARTSDPLLGGARIPPQDLPIPNRDVYGAGTKPDPLLGGSSSPTAGTPTSDSDRTDRSPPPPKKTPNDSTYRTPPPSSSGPYRPDKGSTAAALAGVVPVDDGDLSIGSRPPVTPAGGIPTSIPGKPTPLRPPQDSSLTGGQTFEQIGSQLRQYGAKFTAADKEGNQYTFRADVPVPGGMPGQVRRYEGMGPTPAAAAKQVLDQVKVDSPSR